MAQLAQSASNCTRRRGDRFDLVLRPERNPRRDAVTLSGPTGWTWVRPQRLRQCTPRHFFGWLYQRGTVPAGGRLVDPLTDGRPYMYMYVHLMPREQARRWIRGDRVYARGLLESALEDAKTSLDDYYSATRNVRVRDIRLARGHKVYEHSFVSYSSCGRAETDDLDERKIVVPSTHRRVATHVTRLGVVAPPRRGGPWIAYVINAAAWADRDCSSPPSTNVRRWLSQEWDKRLALAATRISKSIRWRRHRPPAASPPLDLPRHRISPAPACDSIARSLQHRMVAGFPPRPTPTVAELDIPYEYLNYLNAYRDVALMLLRGRASDVPDYRARTNVDRPGARAGIDAALANWSRLAPDIQANAPAQRDCQLIYEWRWAGRDNMNVLRLEQYLPMRLDYTIALALARMQGPGRGPVPLPGFPDHPLFVGIPDRPVLGRYFRDVYLMALHARLDEYAPMHELNYARHEPFP
jgi:hypothetical protein